MDVLACQVWTDKNGKQGVRPSAFDEPSDWPKSTRENFKEPVIERRDYGKGGGGTRRSRAYIAHLEAHALGSVNTPP